MKKGRKIKRIIIPFVIVFVIILGCGGSSSSTTTSTSTPSTPSTPEQEIASVEVAETVVDPRQTPATSIADFYYETDNGIVKLTGYKGQDKLVHVASSYVIDGNVYVVDLTDFQVGIGNHIETVVFDEGITELRESVFNSCGVQNIYFPSTITNLTEYTLSYLHPDDNSKIQIYYPLSQDDWMNVYVNGPSGYSDAYNAGAEAAKNLNEFFGGEVTDETSTFADQFEFHFGNSDAGDAVSGSELAYTQETVEDYADAETPSYEDLMRYPDTYKTKKIKVTVKITDVEPDGIIFDGNIMGTYEGKEIGVVDNRVNKEPKMLEGDTVVIYGYGKGTGTIKEKEGFKTVDSYMIPLLDIRVLEIQ